MIPFFARFFRLFARDEAFFERVTRAVLMAFATGGVAFGDQLASAAGLAGWGRGIKIAGMVCGFLSLLIPAGQKNAQAPTLTLSGPANAEDVKAFLAANPEALKSALERVGGGGA